MTDRLPNDDDLLLFDVIELIKAYEEGLFGRMSNEPADEVILTGYQSPLTGLESTLELSLLAADSSMEEIVNSVTAQQRDSNQTPESEETLTVIEEEDVEYFYSECSLTDKDGNPTDEWWNSKGSTVKKNLDFMGDKPVEYEYKKRFTNEYNLKFGGKSA